MKTLRNIMLAIVIITAVIITGVCTFYNYQISPVSKDDTIINIEIPANTTSKQIASILKENKLIRDERIFIIYLKIMRPGSLKAGYYELSKNMGVKKIVSILEDGSKINPNEINLTFKEGITMRDIAKVISNNTNNSYDAVIEKSNDSEYLNKVIEKYWFLTNDILNENIYYKLEGYLFPETYRFDNKDVTVEEIFNKMLDQTSKVLEPMKSDIEKSSLSIHQIITLASMVEKESYGNIEDRKNVASVFINRMNRGMSLGSDVTTRYVISYKDSSYESGSKALSKAQYQTVSPYNTRLTDGSMNGKLPVGPISTVSKECLEAAVYPNSTNYIYFIANIKTKETFFFSDASSFEAKKNELRSVNGGL